MRLIEVGIGAEEYVTATFDAPADNVSADTLQLALTVADPVEDDWKAAVNVTRVDDHHITGSIKVESGTEPGPYQVHTRIVTSDENVPRLAGWVIVR